MPASNSSGLTRRELLQSTAAAAALGGATKVALSADEERPAPGNQPAPRRPNIVFIIADQFRGDCVGADGNAVIQTPNLDRLAAQGVLFRRAYSSVPSCTPARATILTGLSPWNHGMLGYSTVCEQYSPEMPRMLREAGYYTLGIGKMHYHPQRNTHGFHKTILDESGRVEDPGFISDYRQWFKSAAPDKDPDATGLGWNDHRAEPYALDEKLHPTAWTGDQAVAFLKDHPADQPFFLKVSFARPHSPYDPPQRWWKKYADAPLPPAAIGDWAERHAQRGKKHGNALWQGDLGAEVVRHSRQGYYGSVSFVDEQVGRIVQALQARGEMDNTLILFTSDHGDMTGDHHLWRKTYGYEPSARIPMIVRWGDGLVAGRRGQVLSQCVELRDLLPTFLDAAGVRYDATKFDGRSMLDLPRGKTEGWRPFIDLEHATCYAPENCWTGLTDGHIKYIYYALDGRQQLFDLDKDPQEKHDLSAAAEAQETLRLWRKRMVDHLAVRGEPFVRNGDLAIRPKPFLHSPKYPGVSGQKAKT